MRWLSAFLVPLLVILFLPLACSRGQPDPNQNRLRTSVFGSAGGTAAGSGRKMGSTLGQPSAIGASSDQNRRACLGFWYGGRLATLTDADLPPIESYDRLLQNYPNPFNPSTTFRFSLSSEAFATLTIYNVKGEVVRVLVSDVMEEGTHTVTWDGKNQRGSAVSSGVYFYKLKSDRFEAVRKMVLLR
jgi:hypothetical protein